MDDAELEEARGPQPQPRPMDDAEIEEAQGPELQPRPRADFDLDAILRPLGGFGKFQIMNLLHIAFIITLASITELLYVFTAGELPHR